MSHKLSAVLVDREEIGEGLAGGASDRVGKDGGVQGGADEKHERGPNSG